MVDFGTPIGLFGILLALVPAFSLFVYLARAKKTMWFVFVIGAVGWAVALVLRTPILGGISGFLRGASFADALVLPYIAIGIASLFAGLFEEGIRYVLVKKIQRIRADFRHVLSFGLGWGFGEALLMYALAIFAALYMQRGGSLTPMSLLLGALERNMAITMHVGLTFLIFRSMTDVRFLFAAIGTHFMINLVGVSLYMLTDNIWTTYSFTLVISFVLVVYSYRLTKQKSKK